jgi:hypothetical protein
MHPKSVRGNTGFKQHSNQNLNSIHKQCIDNHDFRSASTLAQNKEMRFFKES